MNPCDLRFTGDMAPKENSTERTPQLLENEMQVLKITGQGTGDIVKDDGQISFLTHQVVSMPLTTLYTVIKNSEKYKICSGEKIKNNGIAMEIFLTWFV